MKKYLVIEAGCAECNGDDADFPLMRVSGEFDSYEKAKEFIGEADGIFTQWVGDCHQSRQGASLIVPRDVEVTP